ncbi:MAG: hypothetical protein KatS3mg066_3851 [Fischerella sp.]|nr:MAG: hypothetical protein KatS3mg066_3851 [Fischerella sp.]
MIEDLLLKTDKYTQVPLAQGARSKVYFIIGFCLLFLL